MPYETTSPLEHLPGLKGINRVQSIPKPPRPPLRFTGIKELRLQKAPDIIGGPGEPPEGFVTAHTSKTEWVWYWGSAKVLKDPKDPRKPPYTGGANWQYQKAIDGGRVVGGQVVDFIYILDGRHTLGVRIQTEHFHIYVDAEKLMADFFLKEDQRAVDQIIDAYDYEWLWDKTGRAVCAAVSNAIRGIQNYSPNIAGTAQRLRGGIF